MNFQEMYKINVNERTEKKNGLTYLSWAWAWAEFVKAYPDATYEIERTPDGLTYFGNEKHGYMCHTKVNANGITHEMWLPVMDHRNKSILVPTSFDVNKTIMRCLTKNLAMFGLGLYIYAGEDLPEEEQNEAQQKKIESNTTYITDEQALHVANECAEMGSNLLDVLKHFKLKSLDKMTIKNFDDFEKMMAVKRAKMPKGTE